MRLINRRFGATVGVFCLSLAPLCAQAAPAGAETADIFDMGLEELLKVEVSSVSRKVQTLADAAAAVFVLSGEDIQRSGARSVPEALRMVPGVEVARLGNNRWAVSARGFNGRFANKLLVLMDGRTVYSPLFAGVFWEAQDTLLDDIERIEVVRGPGAAIWGANAVNGVINIITRQAKNTQGTLMTAAGGSEERSLLAGRYGGSAGDDTHYRVFGKAFERDGSVSADGRDGNDFTRSARAGFRLDRRVQVGQALTLIGDVYDTKTGDQWSESALTALFSVPRRLTQRNAGVNLLGRYEWRLEGGSEATLQAYVDHTKIDLSSLVSESRDTIDVDFQHRFAPAARHDVVWGLGYRASRDDIRTFNDVIRFDPRRRTVTQWSGFVHDEITLIPDRLRLIAGAKFERTNLTPTVTEPNLRFLWTPNATNTIWGAWSRAVRTPSRAELDDSIVASVVPAGDPRNPSRLPLLVQVRGPEDGNLRSERLRAIELGYRSQLAPNLSLDVALYWNRYNELRSLVSGAPVVQSSPVANVTVPSVRTNGGSASSRGVEAAVDWHPAPAWRLQLSYSHSRLDVARGDDPTANGIADIFEGNSPRYQGSMRSSHDFGTNQKLDIWLRRVGGLAVGEIPAYTTLDIRYAWQPIKGLELSLVGQNLLDPRHPEFISDFLPAEPLEVQRGYYLKAALRF